MSHVIDYAPGAVEQKIRHLGALAHACACIMTKDGKHVALELRLMPGCELGPDGQLYKNGELVTEGNAHYKTWKDDHGGRLVGDWPLPKGMTTAQVGDNAVAVISLTDAAKKESKSSYQPYEVGVIPHVDKETGELTYSLTHDFYCGGFGLENYVGATELDYGKADKGERVKSAHGDLLMHYQMQCARIAAEEAGHSIEFHQESDGTYYAVVDKETQGLTA